VEFGGRQALEDDATNLDQLVGVFESRRHLAPSYERQVRRTQDGADNHADNAAGVFATTNQHAEVKRPTLS
jgi:hypothetical protein